MRHFLRYADSEISQSQSTSLRKCFTFGLLLIFVVACAAPVSVEKKTSSQSVENNQTKTPAFRSMPSDVDYLYYGLSHLAATPEKPPDFEKAGIAFETLMKEHPDSIWKESAMVLNKILQDLRDYRDKEKTARALHEKSVQDRINLSAEIEKLSKANSTLSEKMQSEIAKLLQENERLKKDIELLKDLEIKLDKRERLLR